MARHSRFRSSHLAVLGAVGLFGGLLFGPMAAVPARADDGPASGAEVTTASAAAYRYWSYWWGRPDGSWTFATMGAASTRPKDRSVEGWRFAVSADSASGARHPRTNQTFDALCPNPPAAAAGQKRVAVVIDPGVVSDAPSGETPAAAHVACVQVPESANGAQVLAKAAALRTNDGMVCGLDGYPQSECAVVVRPATSAPAVPPVKEPTAAPHTQAPSVNSPTPAGSTSNPSDTTSTGDQTTTGDSATTTDTGGSLDTSGTQDTTGGALTTADGTDPAATSANPADAGTGDAVPGADATSSYPAGDPSADELPSDAGADPAASPTGQEPDVQLVRADTNKASAGSPVPTILGLVLVAVLAAAAWLLYRRRAIAAAGKPGHSAGAPRQSAPKQAGPKHTGKN